MYFLIRFTSILFEQKKVPHRVRYQHGEGLSFGVLYGYSICFNFYRAESGTYKMKGIDIGIIGEE